MTSVSLEKSITKPRSNSSKPSRENTKPMPYGYLMGPDCGTSCGYSSIQIFKNSRIQPDRKSFPKTALNPWFLFSRKALLPCVFQRTSRSADSRAAKAENSITTRTTISTLTPFMRFWETISRCSNGQKPPGIEENTIIPSFHDTTFPCTFHSGQKHSGICSFIDSPVE